jgi:hypothetical protein
LVAATSEGAVPHTTFGSEGLRHCGSVVLRRAQFQTPNVVQTENKDAKSIPEKMRVVLLTLSTLSLLLYRDRLAMFAAGKSSVLHTTGRGFDEGWKHWFQSFSRD